MKQLIYITCLLFYSNGFGQDTLNVIDQYEKKQGHWIYYGKDRPDLGIPLEGKIEEGNYVDDRKEGTWIKYHNDGKTPKIIGTYENNRPKGEYSKYNEDGSLREAGTFDQNNDDKIKIGSTRGGHSEWNSFYDSLERIKYQAQYNQKGQEEGLVQYFYSNGQLEFEYFAENGTAVGKATRYYENGDVKELIEYAADGTVLKSTEYPMINPPIVSAIAVEKTPIINPTNLNTNGIKWQPNGYNKIYTNDNEIWLDGAFKNGQLWDGKVYVFDQDGILLKVKVFKSGLYHSDGQL